MSDEARWIELKDSFARLTDMPSAERSARLAMLRDSDSELYEELCELLDADAHADAMLARLDVISSVPNATAANGAGPSVAPAPPPPATDPFDLVGRTVSHFHVLDVLAAGATSVVYRAEDVRAARIVALKFPLQRFASDPLSTRRFLERARATAALGHPNVCAVHESGETENGDLFLAMEYYSGETLEARLSASGALPVSEALRIAEGLLRGLGAAHAAGLVHHSFEPSHVMLTSDGGVKILDFGLANARDLAITSGEHPRESVEYMSPEQLDGDTVDGRSDLWSFGVVFYEMLTGKPPFGRGRDLATVYGILHDDPPPPSAIRVDVPAICDEVVTGLLRKKPSERPASAEQVLETLASARPTPARTREQAAMLRRRARPFAGPVAAAAAFIVLALLARAYSGHRARPAEGGEVLRLYGQGDFRLLRGQPQLDSALVEFRAAIALDSSFAPAWAALAETDVARSNLASPGVELLRDAETAANRAIALDPRLADAYTAKAMVLTSRGSRPAYDSAEASFRRAIALDSTSVRAHHYYSLLLLVQRRDDDAIAENQRALRADPSDPAPRVANGMLLLVKGQRRAARDTLRQALATSASYVATPSYLGFIEADDGSFADARKHLELARAGGELFPGVRSALAYVYGKRGRMDERDVLLSRIRGDTSDDRARIDRALSWAVMGDVDGAYARLRDERWDLASVQNVVVNPLLKRFRADRRYARLAKRIGITH